MKLRGMFGMAAALVLSAQTLSFAIDIPVANSSFEIPGVVGFTYNPDDSSAGGASGGWDFNPGSAGIDGQQGAFAADTLASDGIQVGFLQKTTEIAQNIVDASLPALNGQTLYVSFDAAGRVINPSDGELFIMISDTGGGNTQTLAQIPIPIGAPTGLNGLRELAHYETSFVMPNFGDQFRLRIGHFNPNGDDVSTLIDNVRVTTVTTIITPLVGDLDGDGFVGIGDLNLVLGNWNLSVPPGNPLADPSGDNFIGIDDLNLVLGNWNNGTPPLVATAVPEPASLALVGLGALAVSGRIRRR